MIDLTHRNFGRKVDQLSAKRCGLCGSGLPDAALIDKPPGWVSTETGEWSGIREDHCRKQVSGRQSAPSGKPQP